MPTRTFYALLIWFFILGCSKQHSKTIVAQDKSIQSSHLNITAVDGKLPLYIESLDISDPYNSIHLNDGLVSKITSIIKDYSKECAFNDSTKTLKDTYINTIRIHDNIHTIYLVLLLHNPTNVVNSRVLFYDNQSKEFLDYVFDFNLWALYNCEKGKLFPTELKNALKIKTPEIELVDYNKDGINDFKFVRLYHNGTFNAIHTTILSLRNNKVDTLHIEEQPIGGE